MNQEILDDLLEECPCKDRWCFPRQLFLNLKLTERDAEQIRLICDERYMDSKKNGKEIEKNTAAFYFIKEHAARFAEVYKEGKKKDELFKEVFGTEKVHTDEYVPYLHQETLDDLLEECPCKDKWCFPKELLSYQSKKLDEELRLMYVYRYLVSEKEGKDIGEERMKKEFGEKYEKKFEEVYKEGMTHKELSEAINFKI
jgi:hypothetical protein